MQTDDCFLANVFSKVYPIFIVTLFFLMIIIFVLPFFGYTAPRDYLSEKFNPPGLNTIENDSNEINNISYFESNYTVYADYLISEHLSLEIYNNTGEEKVIITWDNNSMVGSFNITISPSCYEILCNKQCYRCEVET